MMKGIIMTDIYMTILRALLSILVLFLITKLIGCRQMSQLNMFDYINGITIGSIASELAVSDNENLPVALTALLVYGLAGFLLAVATDRSLVIRKIITGKPRTLYSDGRLHEQNFKKARMDLNEFLMLCRNSGYFDLSQVDTILLEPNGKLSIFPMTKDRPATPTDLQKNVKQEPLPIEIILDGKVLTENLSAAGYDTEWLEKQLKNQRVESRQVFLAVYTDNGQLQTDPREHPAGE